MIEILSWLPIVLFNSIIYHPLIKISDLLDEHGLKLFRYADIFFGIISGIVLSLAVSFNSILASFYLAYLLGMIIRGKVDYPNHRITAAIIIASMMFSGIASKIDWFLFIVIFSVFVPVGLLADYGIIKKNFITKTQLHVYLTLLALMIFNFNYWIPLISYLLGSVLYHIVRTWGQK